MEITEPVILQVPQPRRKPVRIELESRADARDLIAAIARSMERLPDDGQGLIAPVEVQELPDVDEAEPHDDGTSYCTSLPEHDHDTASPEEVAALAASITAGTYVVVTDDEHPFDAGEGSRELSGPGRELLRQAIADEDAAAPVSLEAHRSVRLLRDGEKLVAVESTPCPEFYPGKFTGCIGSKGHEPPCRDLDGDEWVPALTAGAL